MAHYQMAAPSNKLMEEEFDSALEAVLMDTRRLMIHQEIEHMEAAAQAAANAVNLDALGAFGETANKYDVFTDDGGKKFRVVETSDYLACCDGRVCCRPNHSLKLHVYLPEIDQEHGVMHMDRPCKCGQCCACFNCCRQEMKVYEGEGLPDILEDPSKLIGYIQQPFLGGGLSPTDRHGPRRWKPHCDGQGGSHMLHRWPLLRSYLHRQRSHHGATHR